MTVERLFISRYLFSPERSRSFALFATIAAAGVALGVAAVIVAVSVLDGFEKTIAEKIVGFNAHLQAVGFSGKALPGDPHWRREIEATLGDRLERVEPFVVETALLSNKRSGEEGVFKIKEGATVKGVRPDYFSSGIDARLVAGSLDLRNEGDEYRVALGGSLARKLMAEPGDKITVFALRGETPPTPDNPPIIERFAVSGVFETGMDEYDRTFAYVSMEAAQRAFGFPDSISGYEIQLTSVERVDSVAAALQKNLPYPFYVRSVFKSYAHIFAWIELQREPIPIVLGLIALVAVFNIVSALLTLALDKTNAVGTLKALGASRGAIARLFLYQGAFLGFLGVAGGNLLAYGLAQLQISYGIVSLPADIYFISSAPIALDWRVFAVVSAITFPLCIVTSALPGWIAANIDPIRTLRFR